MNGMWEKILYTSRNWKTFSLNVTKQFYFYGMKQASVLFI